MISIAIVTTDQDIADARNLMRRYVQWTGIDLCFQNFGAELAELPGKYVAPLGALWLARITHHPIRLASLQCARLMMRFAK